MDFKDKLNKAWEKTKEVAGEVGKGAKEGYEKAKEEAPGAWDRAKADMKHAAGAVKSSAGRGAVASFMNAVHAGSDACAPVSPSSSF